MRASSLAIRVAYTVAAAPLGWAVGFYSAIQLLPWMATSHPQMDTQGDGSGIFHLAVCAGVAMAFICGLLALTLPGIRHRKKAGRSIRIACSSILVIVASLLFADLRFKLIYNLLFAAGLTYVLTYTLIRYGVIDERSERSSRRSRYDRGARRVRR